MPAVNPRLHTTPLAKLPRAVTRVATPAARKRRFASGSAVITLDDGDESGVECALRPSMLAERAELALAVGDLHKAKAAALSCIEANAELDRAWSVIRALAL